MAGRLDHDARLAVANRSECVISAFSTLTISHFMSKHLMSRQLMNAHLIGRHLISVHLMGRYW